MLCASMATIFGCLDTLGLFVDFGVGHVSMMVQILTNHLTRRNLPNNDQAS